MINNEFSPRREATQRHHDNKPLIRHRRKQNPFRSHSDRNNIPNFEEVFSSEPKETSGPSKKTSSKPRRPKLPPRATPRCESRSEERDKENAEFGNTNAGPIELITGQEEISPIKSCISGFTKYDDADVKDFQSCNKSCNKSTISDAGGSSFIGNTSMANMSVLSIGCRAALNEHRRHIAKYGLDSSLLNAENSAPDNKSDKQQTPSPLSMVSPSDDARARVDSADAEWDRLLDTSSSFIASSSFLDGDHGNRSRCNTGNSGVYVNSRSYWSSTSAFDSSASNVSSDFFNSSRVNALSTPEKNRPLVDKASELARQGIGLCQRNEEFYEDFDEEDAEAADEVDWANQTDIAEKAVKEILGLSYSNMNRSAVDTPTKMLDISRLTINDKFDDIRPLGEDASFAEGASFVRFTSMTTPSASKGRSSTHASNGRCGIHQEALFDMSPIAPDHRAKEENDANNSPFASLTGGKSFELSPIAPGDIQEMRRGGSPLFDGLDNENSFQMSPIASGHLAKQNANHMSNGFLSPLQYNENEVTNPNASKGIICQKSLSKVRRSLVLEDDSGDGTSPVIQPSSKTQHERHDSGSSGSSLPQSSIKKMLSYGEKSLSSENSNKYKDHVKEECPDEMLHTTNPNTPEFNNNNDDEARDPPNVSLLSYNVGSEFHFDAPYKQNDNLAGCSFLSAENEYTAFEAETSFSSICGNNGTVSSTLTPPSKSEVLARSDKLRSNKLTRPRLCLGAKRTEDMLDLSPIKDM